jgi:uncharacterized protein
MSASLRGILAAAGVLARLAVAGLVAGAFLAGWPAPARAAFRLPPHDTRSVYDFASVVRPEDAAVMERWHRALFDATGVAIVVITVPDLDGEPLEDFATRVGTEWGIGKKGEDRGIVVALSMKPRRIHVATGYGVEGFLPDGKVGGVIDDEVMPYLKAGDFSRGLRQASAALTSISAREFNLTIEGLQETRGTPAHGQDRGGWPGILFVAVILLFFFVLRRNPLLAAILLANAGRRGGRGGWSSGGFGGGGFGGGGFGGFGGGGFGGGGAGRGF